MSSLFSRRRSRAPAGSQTGESKENFKQLVDEAWTIIDSGYIDSTFNGVNWLQARASLIAKDYATKAEVYQAIIAMLDRLQAPATRLLTLELLSAFITEITGKKHQGAGLLELLSIDVDERSRKITVVTPVRGINPEYKVSSRFDTLKKSDAQLLSGMEILSRKLSER